MKATELLQSQTNADTQDKGELTSEDVTRLKQVKGTPFTLVIESNRYYPIIGEYRLTEEAFETELKAIEFLEKKDWNTILTLIIATIKRYNELNKK